MPRIDVVFFRDDDGTVPVLNWLQNLKQREKRVYAKCLARIAVLEEEGHELRRPLSDYLRDGIHELRIRFGTVNYHILYFLSGQTAAILAHGLMKEDRVPDKDIELAVSRRAKFVSDPEGHGYEQE